LNGGKAGEWAVDGVKRLPDVMREAEPNVVFLMEGVNDLNGLAALGNGAVSPTIGALESMIKYARARGVRVFLATLPPQRRGGLRAASIDILPRFNDEIRRTAAEEGATLVDVNSAFDPALIGQDGLHPTEAGYSRLAEIFLDAIKAHSSSRASQETIYQSHCLQRRHSQNLPDSRVDDITATGDERVTGDFIALIDLQIALGSEMQQERHDVLCKHLAGMIGHR